MNSENRHLRKPRLGLDSKSALWVTPAMRLLAALPMTQPIAMRKVLPSFEPRPFLELAVNGGYTASTQKLCEVVAIDKWSYAEVP